jgi:hypothetical protein
MIGDILIRGRLFDRQRTKARGRTLPPVRLINRRN